MIKSEKGKTVIIGIIILILVILFYLKYESQKCEKPTDCFRRTEYCLCSGTEWAKQICNEQPVSIINNQGAFLYMYVKCNESFYGIWACGHGYSEITENEFGKALK